MTPGDPPMPDRYAPPMSRRGDKEHLVDANKSELCASEVGDLLELESGLSDWEVEFVDSVNQQIDAGRLLTSRQEAKIHQIWDKHCG